MKSLRCGAVCMLYGTISLAVLAANARAEDLFIDSGSLWPDNNGVHVNAHGGGVLFHQGTYFWYGEHKVAGPSGNRAQVGVHVYSSKDLKRWKDEGIALQVSDNPKSDIFKGCVLERPKVIYNRKTGKYVMWFHLELIGCGYSSARAGVAVADSPTGPFTFLHSLRPNAGTWPLNATQEVTDAKAMARFEQEHKGLMGQEFAPGEQDSNTYKTFMTHWHDEDNRLEIYRRDFSTGQFCRDMTLFVDDDATAYHLFASEENQTLHISRLSDDYLSHSGQWARVQPGGKNEAPAIFNRDGKYYLLSSGCTGWAPNEARSFVADTIFGPYEPLGNPCRGTNPQNNLGPEKTFGGQSTFVLPMPGKKDAFVAMFDEWRPKNPIDGRYYWLPIVFTENGFAMEWSDAWSPDESF
ncbi:glycoside hydrolase family 43 protein [Novipirellula artificiosorum]|uniref:Glycosyl hydrolases family 43 n=1 Tax=Novipirellula artificiosorum TaxID=2528016 RepID=A0A5C6DPP2_9BACT|nr:glycoside hydrolase family 43 protein [Novipirellula artificiosorum]TWU38195.1 Glycosyl hydrolases family 43 [Novipirellula artificiosorum]